LRPDSKPEHKTSKATSTDFRDVVVTTDEHQETTLRQLAADAPLVVFLVPKANTPGCNRQYESYTQQYERFAAHGVRCYVLSKDKPDALARWRAKYQSQVPGLSDPAQTLIAKLKARKAPANTIRSHFIFAKGTAEKLAEAIPVSPDKSCEMALKSLEELGIVKKT
jgi:peroxiredoxin Q/BCP